MHALDLGANLTASPGATLKNIRNNKGLTLSDLSELTGFPVSTLSKLENGRTELTVDKLLRITLALGVNVADLFRSPTNAQEKSEYSCRRSITRSGEGDTVSSHTGDYTHLSSDLLSKQIKPIIGEIKAKSVEEFGEFHRHSGEEFLYVLEGELLLYTDTYGPTHLKAGDAIQFDSMMGHAYVAKGDAPCRIMTVSSTPDAEILAPAHGESTPLRVLSSVSEKKDRT